MAVRKTAAKAATKKTAPKKTAAPKTAPKKAAPKKAAAQKTAPKKTATKKTATKKTTAPPAGTETGTTAVTQNDTVATLNEATLVVGAGEDPWTAEELAEIRAELADDLERQRRQVAAVSEDLDEMRKTGEPSGDAADVGTSNFERDQELALAAHAHEAVQQTELALDRIAAGTWGVCENCGEPIGKGRLQVYPRATLCMTCKKREERR